MLPVKFEGANAIIGAAQAEHFEPLPAQVFKDKEGVVLTFWQFSDVDKARINKGEPIWLATQTFGRPLQPVLLTTDRPTF